MLRLINVIEIDAIDIMQKKNMLVEKIRKLRSFHRCYANFELNYYYCQSKYDNDNFKFQFTTTKVTLITSLSNTFEYILKNAYNFEFKRYIYIRLNDRRCAT